MEIFIFSCLLIGAFGGLCVGLLGIGSGVIIVPALSTLLAMMAVPLDQRLPVAIATSLATMIITTGVSSIKQLRKKNVRLDMLKFLFPTIILGAIFGVMIMESITTTWLKGFFAVILFLLALNLLYDRLPRWHHLQRQPWLLSFEGGIVASLSTLLGLGGGVFFIPLFRAANIPIKSAIGTSNVCAFLVAITGTISYVMNAQASPFYGMHWYTGYIYWPAVIGIAVTSIPFALLGVHLMHRAENLHLQRGFAVLLMCVAVFMIF